MKYMYWGLGLIMSGLFGIVFIIMLDSLTIADESEYYVLKEAMEAAMLESVDLACFRNSNQETNGCNGSLKISEQKFVENFTRRFAQSVSGDISSYTVEFYDIMESPPKASIKITGNSQTYILGTANNAEDNFNFGIVNNLTGILEGKDWNEIVKNRNYSVLEQSNSLGS